MIGGKDRVRLRLDDTGAAAARQPRQPRGNACPASWVAMRQECATALGMAAIMDDLIPQLAAAGMNGA